MRNYYFNRLRCDENKKMLGFGAHCVSGVAMVDQRTLVTLLGFLFLLFHSTVQQQIPIRSRTEWLGLIELRSSLGLRSKEWPIKSDPCLVWRGVKCEIGRVVEINISGFKRTRLGAKNPQFSVDALSNFTLLASFNASRFLLPGSIPEWFGLRLTTLQVLDLRSCSISGAIPSSIGNLTNLISLYLSDNLLAGMIPPSLDQLSNLSVLDVSRNSFTGFIPSFASLGNLTSLDMSGNSLSGAIPETIGTLSKLQLLNLSNNGLSSSLPAQLGGLSNLAYLDLSLNSLSGSFSDNLFSSVNRLQFIVLNNNDFSGGLPNVLWSLPDLLFLDASHNNFSGELPNLTFSANVSTALLNLSHNMLYGGLKSVLRRFSFVNMTNNYFEGRIPDYVRSNATLDRNCLQNSSSQRSVSDCASFYSARGLTFDNFGLPNATQSPAKVDNKNRLWIIVAGIAGGVVLLVIVVVLLICCICKQGVTDQRRTTGAGPVPAGRSPPPPSLSLDLSGLGEAFTYQQILMATDNFNDGNLIKNGHSGDLFRGILEGGIRVVIKRVDLQSVKKDAYKLELDFFCKVSHARLVPLLGHCLENDNEKFLVYKYIPNGDLSSSLHRQSDSTDDSLQSLDWITRLKIAIGAAEGLSYLHHECSPPFVHRDVQASSILLDDKFEVRLGSLSDVCAQEGDAHQSRITRLLRLSTTSEQGPPGSTTAACAYDVYCFGKVLLELVTGKLGISGSGEAGLRDWFDSTLPHISIYDKERVTNIVDPSLIIDEDLLEEVWAMAIVAKSCLNPKPPRRPLMRYILKALENPLKVVREENSGSARLQGSSRGSWNAALFGSWRQSSSDAVAVSSASHAIKGEGVSSLKQSATSNSQGSGQNGAGDRSSSTRRQSKEVFPEPSDERNVEREHE